MYTLHVQTIHIGNYYISKKESTFQDKDSTFQRNLHT